MTIRFGILPQVETCICMDLDWLDGSVLFPEALPGGLKIVCHGRRIDKSQVKRVKLVTIPCFHEVAVRLSKPELLADIPAGFIEEVSPNLPGKKLVDCFGQNKQKDWTIYGGWKRLKLSEGTGYFTKYKKNETLPP